jgi:hypothetical protein
MAEVERNWFRRVLAGEQAPSIYDPHADPHGHADLVRERIDGTTGV